MGANTKINRAAKVHAENDSLTARVDAQNEELLLLRESVKRAESERDAALSAISKLPFLRGNWHLSEVIDWSAEHTAVLDDALKIRGGR